VRVLDSIVLKRSWAGDVRSVSLLVAIGVNTQGFREILGICEGGKEGKAGWSVRSSSTSRDAVEGSSTDHLGRPSGACQELPSSSRGCLATVCCTLASQPTQPGTFD
jgi:hypothetical protein